MIKDILASNKIIKQLKYLISAVKRIENTLYENEEKKEIMKRKGMKRGPLNVFIYSGYLYMDEDINENETLFISSEKKPISEVLSQFTKKMITVRYYITNKELNYAEVTEAHLYSICGDIESKYEPLYSEITGYLYTDERLNVGGHNLLDELKSFCGKYLTLVIEVY